MKGDWLALTTICILVGAVMSFLWLISEGNL